MASGFLLDYRSFTGNVLSEISGIALSAVLAVLIFERVAERERRRRWEGVRSQLYGALVSQLTDIAFEVYIALPVEVREASPDVITTMLADNELTSDTVVSAAVLTDVVRANIESLMASEDDGANAGSVYDSAVPNLDRISDTLVPQLLQLGQDPQLIVELSQLGSAVRVWEWNLRMNQIYGGPSTWDGVIGVLGSVHDVLQYINSQRS
jgi:hypothetical protein